MISQTALSSQLLHRNIEDLKGRKDPEALQAAAKELEALFAYEMIKAMRGTTEATKGGFGKDAYMSLFDTELSRIFADRGLGLKELLLKGLNRQMNKEQGAGVKGQSDAMQNTGVRSQNIGAGIQNSESSSQETRSNKLSEVSGQEKKVETQKLETRSQETGPLPLVPQPQALPRAPEPSIVEPNVPVDGVISSNFGLRKHPLYGDSRFHRGMDIAAPVGTKVYPYQGGKVVFSGEQAGYGNTIVIDHGNGYVTKYAHNRINLVKAGDLVDEDTVIAEVGSTGLSTGPHLHFEVRQHGKYLDPARVLALK